MTSKNPRGKRHARIYHYELETPAYRSLSPDARALLIEFRALYNGYENRVFFSVREMAKRLGISQKPAQKARDQLLDRGFIRLITEGSFNRKVRHASVYALESEALTNRDGDVEPKSYMRWQPSERKSTVVRTTKDGSQLD